MSIKNFLLNAGLLLAVFVCLRSIAVSMPPPNIPYNSTTNTYSIYTLSQLDELSNYVKDIGRVASTGTPWTSTGKTFILMNDISGFNNPIGTEFKPFFGTFDGNGKKITVSIDTSGWTIGVGIFGYAENATIKNLTAAGSIYYYNASYSGDSFGGILGLGSNTTITNCTNLSDITASGFGAMHVGGIVGELYGGTITHCSNAGNIMTTGDEAMDVGGIVGYLKGNACSISNCVNIGKVKGEYHIGGIVGLFDAKDITHSINAGWVSGNTNTGGIIGIVYSLESMQNCLNTGVVQGTSDVHSLVGGNNIGASLASKISDCHYDNQMSPHTGVQGMIDVATGVRGWSTNDLTKVNWNKAITTVWHKWPDCYSSGVVVVFPQTNQTYSYPFMFNGNTYIHTLASMPVRLSNGECWNNVNSSVILDVGYWIYVPRYNRTDQWPTEGWNTFLSVNWQTSGLSLTNGYLTHNLGSYIKYVSNPGISNTFELTAYIDAGGYRYKKTVPIITNGTPFKISVDEYETYGFETSEVTPNIVTSNAVIGISSAIEGNLNVAVFDMSGAKVMNVVDKNVTAQSQTQVELNGLHNLTAGSYMVAVSLGNNVVFRRFIKQ